MTDPTPPPVPPDAPRLLSVEDEELLAEWRPDPSVDFGMVHGTPTADEAVRLVAIADRLLAAARLAATLQDHQEQAVGAVSDAVRRVIGRECWSLADLNAAIASALRPLPVEDEEEPK